MDPPLDRNEDYGMRDPMYTAGPRGNQEGTGQSNAPGAGSRSLSIGS